MLQLLRRNEKRFQGGLVFKAHRPVYHSTLGWRVIKKKKGERWDETSKGEMISPPRLITSFERPVTYILQATPGRI